MTYKQGSTIFNDLVREKLIKTPTELTESTPTTEPIIYTPEITSPKITKQSHLINLAIKTQVSELETLPIKKTQLPTPLHLLYDAITYALTNHITISKRHITHPKQLIELIEKHQTTNN